MSQTSIVLPLDYTGKAATNLIKDEEQELVGSGSYLVGADWGPFYGKPIDVVVGGVRLVRGVDYVPAGIDSYLSKRTGKEVLTGIVITAFTQETKAIISYQAVGGPVNVNQKLLRQQVANEKIGHQAANWNTSVVNKPLAYQPVHHLHDGGLDVYGMEYIVSVLRGIADATVIGIDPTLDLLKKRMQDYLSKHVLSHDHSDLYYEKYQEYTRPEMEERFLNKLSASNTTSVSGAVEVYQGTAAKFQITNFDNRSVYSVSMDGATVSWFSWNEDNYGNDGFAINIPASMPAGDYQYTIICDSASRTLPLKVKGGALATPTVYANLFDTEPTVTYSGSAFAVTNGSDTGDQAELMVTNTATGVVIYDQTVSLVNGTLPSTTLTNLALDTQFDAKVRYRGVQYGWTQWSAVVSVKTKVTYVVTPPPDPTPDPTPVPVISVNKPVLSLTQDIYTPTAHCSGSDFAMTNDTTGTFKQYVAKYYDVSNPTAVVFVSGADNWSSTHGSKGPTFDLSVSAGKTYKAAIQYKSSDGYTSDWSDEVQFTTLADYTPVPYQVNFEISPDVSYIKYTNENHYKYLVMYYLNIAGFSASQFDVTGFSGDTTFRSMTYGIKYNIDHWFGGDSSGYSFNIVDPNSSAWDSFTAASNPSTYVYESGTYDNTQSSAIATSSLVAGTVTINGVAYNAFRSFTKDVYVNSFYQSETDGGSGSGTFFADSNPTVCGDGVDKTIADISLQFGSGNRLVNIGSCRMFEPSGGSFTAKLKVQLKKQYWPVGNYSYY